MKRIVAGFLVGIVALTLTGCGMNNSTVLDAAKTFTQGEIDGDTKVINEIDHSSPSQYPPQYILSGASKAGYSKHKIDEFKFVQVDDATVNVLGPKDIGDLQLSFIKENGKYFFDSKGEVKITQAQVQAAQQPKEVSVDKKSDDINTMLTSIKGNRTVAGTSTAPGFTDTNFKLHFMQFNESTGNFTGEYINSFDGEISKVEGNISAARLTFKIFTKYSVPTINDLTATGQGSFAGSFKNDTSDKAIGNTVVNVK